MRFATITLFIYLLARPVVGENIDAGFYEEKIKPILKERCMACHGALKQKGKLRIDTVANMHKNDIIKEGELLRRLTTTDHDDIMPPEGEPLSTEQIEFIKQWIAADTPAPKNEKEEGDPTEHWSFQKIERPEIPPGKKGNIIDAFLQTKQKTHGLKAQKPADRSLLLRRLYLDLIGLPPSPEQLADERPVAEIIDALLSSKHYGERWGRHWMDIWRYSDWYGLGKEVRDSQKHLWRWREWIVDSLNDNKGYDKMIREMLAGDELAPNDPQVVAATGFLARSYYKFNRTTWLDNTIEHTSKAFMGLTMNCAKCHDHKYDPIDHIDYYKFRAFFEPYHVRVDALPGQVDVTKNGLARVYDGNLDAATYLHARGEESRAVKNEKILPGPPSFIKSTWEPPESIKLPPEAYRPSLKEFVQHAELTKAQANVTKARAHLQKSQQLNLANTENKQPTTKPSGPKSVLTDNFAKARPDLWEQVGKDWRYQGGLLSLVKPSLGKSYVRSKENHPRDFEVNLTFQTTGGEKWKSTGIRFDVDETGNNSHTVFASAHDTGKVHLFHTVSGKDIYTRGLSKREIKLNQEYTLNLKVREHLINVALDGQFLFAFNLPRREPGSIELFAYDATADFYAIDLKQLPATTVLKTAKEKAAPIATADIIELAKAQLKLAEAEVASVEAVVAADNAIHKNSGQGSAKTAGRMQLKVKLAKAEGGSARSDQGGQSGGENRRHKEAFSLRKNPRLQAIARQCKLADKDR